MSIKDKHARPSDVKKKYFSGGEWKFKFFDKLGKHRHVPTTISRTYVAIPPEGGWIGGDPSKNGYKPSGSK